MTGRTGSSRSSRAEQLVFVIVFASAIWFTAPKLVQAARDAWSMHTLTYDARRTRIFGPLYPSIQRLKEQVPPNEPIALVLHAPDDADLGVYVNYYLHPRRTRIYFGMDAYRRDPRAPHTIAYIDRREAWEVRLLR